MAAVRHRRARGLGCRRRGRRGSGGRHRVPSVGATLGCCVTDGVVDRPPVARLGVLPRLVVGEGGLVAECRRRSFWVGKVRPPGLCKREQRQAQRHSRRQPENEVVHCWKPCESSARRCHSQETLALTDQRTREPRQTSRGGLSGSDGSGRTLLAIRDEARWRSGEVEKLDCTRVKRLDKRRHVAHKGRERTVGRTSIAGFRGCVVMAGMAVVGRLGGAVVTACVVMTSWMLKQQGLVHRLVPGRVASHRLLHLHPRPGDRAQHGSCHRTPGGEQHSQQQQEPDSPGFHERKGSRRGLSPMKRIAGVFSQSRPSHSDKVKRRDDCRGASRQFFRARYRGQVRSHPRGPVTR